MKIVIATPFYPPAIGVLATYAAGLEGALKHNGHDVQVIVSRTLPAGLRHINHFFRILFSLRSVGLLIALDTWTTGVPAACASFLTGTPFALRIGGDHLWETYIARTRSTIRFSDFYPRADFSLKERLIFRVNTFLIRRARRVFFNTGFQKEIWEKAYPLLKGKTVLLENYYPARIETPAPIGRIFVSANRPATYKNEMTLEKAFARAKERHPDIELATHPLPHDEHLARIARAYAVIIPSISEVGSNIAIEAVVRGRPFIMSEDSGTKERLSECGFFIDTRSEKAFEDGLESLLDPAVYERCASAARNFSFVHSWDDIVKEILSAID